MNEWTMFVVIGTIGSFLALVGTPMIKLNTILVKLIATVENLTEQVNYTSKENDKSHDRIWSELDEHEEKINDHETRISLLEDK